MGFIAWAKGVISKMFKSEISKQFGVIGITSDSMKSSIRKWMEIYKGNPDWIDEDNGIRTIKMAKTLCEETARLTTLDLGIQFDGARAEYMQKWSDKAVMTRLRNWVEYGCAYGTIIMKPNGVGVDFIAPGSFEIVSKDGNGCITGIVFQDTYTEDKKHFTKLEYQRFFNASVRMADSEEYKDMTYYTITNKAYVSENEAEIGRETDLINTKWSNLMPEAHITKKNGGKIESMLFGVFRMPAANDIDLDSPLGISIFSQSIEELKDLDISYSRNAEEVADSRKIVLLDDRLINLPATKDRNGNIVRPQIKMPHYVKNVNAGDKEEFYQEIIPQLNTDTRITGINNQLSLIGYKCGYSNGYFVLDQKTGMVTATQVESDDRRTIQLIKDIRDSLQSCLNDLFYAQSVFADLYSLAPVGDYEVSYSFGDITYSYEEDKQTWWKYVQAGKVPAWKYFVKFEKMSEDEAKAMQKEIESSNKDNGLFGEE